MPSNFHCNILSVCREIQLSFFAKFILKSERIYEKNRIWYLFISAYQQDLILKLCIQAWIGITRILRTIVLKEDKTCSRCKISANFCQGGVVFMFSCHKHPVLSRKHAVQVFTYHPIFFVSNLENWNKKKERKTGTFVPEFSLNNTSPPGVLAPT